MQGKIITVDYAETNNLAPQEKLYQSESDLSAYKVFSPPAPDPLSEYIISAGMGGGGSGGGGSGVKLHIGRQGKHMPGHNNYQPGRSIIYGDAAKIQQLLNKFAGKGEKVGINKERVDFGETIGIHVDPDNNKFETTMGTIHHSAKGSHIVPATPKGD